MNYIELINLFWQTRRTVRFTTAEADLYYFLMQESNMRGWENPFECSNGIICAVIGIGENTLINARKRLQEKGLIEFVAGQRKHKSPVYTLLYCKKENIDKGINEGIEKVKTGNLFVKKAETKSKGKSEKKKAAGFISPSVEEVEAYCTERSNRINAQQFFDFYTAKNWLIGRNKMKDWRAAVRTWEQREKYVLHPAADYKPQNKISDERF